MKPIVILLVGGVSLAATLAVTNWLAAREAGQSQIPPQAEVAAAQPPEAVSSPTNSSTPHRHRGWKRDRVHPRSLVRSEAEAR